MPAAFRATSSTQNLKTNNPGCLTPRAPARAAVSSSSDVAARDDEPPLQLPDVLIDYDLKYLLDQDSGSQNFLLEFDIIVTQVFSKIERGAQTYLFQQSSVALSNQAQKN